MDTVHFSEGNNIGGISELLLTPWYLLNNLNPVTFRAGYDWTNMEFLPESASSKDTASDADNGTEYTYSIVLSFNKQSEPLLEAFKPYMGKVGICKFTDNNGFTRIMGTRDNPVTIKQEADTGNSPNNLNYLKITITWTHSAPAQVV